MTKPRDKRPRPATRSAHESGLRRRVEFDPAPDVFAAMIEVSSLVRRTPSPDGSLRPLAEALRRALPLEGLAIATDAHGVRAWTSARQDASLLRLRAFAQRALDHILGRVDRAAFDAEKSAAGAGVAWTTLPLLAADGPPLGVVVLQTAAALDEGDLALASFLARSLAEAEGPGLARAGRAAADREPLWVEETPPSGRVAGMELLSDLTATLFSSLEYTSTISQLGRELVARQVAACVVDIVEPGGLLRIAEAPVYAPAVLDGALAPVVEHVLRSGGHLGAAAKPTVHAASVLGARWVVSVPLLGTDGALGALTLVGDAPHPRLSHTVIAQLAERVTTAIENGRRYRDALAQVKSRDDALATLSHDLKNPIGAILLNAAYVLKTVPDGERRAAGRQQIEAIVRSATRMRGLVADLLDLAALDGGAAPIVPKACALRPLLHEVFQTADIVARNGQIALVDELGDLPDVRIDPGRIVQVLSNIVGNALKFTGPGGSVLARARIHDRELEVSITDTGRGIPEHELEFIFHRFWRAPASAKHGSGLGLAICKTIIEHSGGRIWAESKVDVGTTIFFTLPIA